MFAVCKSNNRQIITAVSLYSKTNNDRLVFNNWIAMENSGPFQDTAGWLYGKRQRTQPEHVKTSALWQHLNNMDVYHCPMHRDRTHNTQKLSSYTMNGMAQHFGALPWFFSSQFNSDHILFWETNEKQTALWNDGSDFPRERADGTKLTYRHGKDSAISAIDGSVSKISNSMFNATLNEANSPLTYCPEHETNH